MKRKDATENTTPGPFGKGPSAETVQDSLNRKTINALLEHMGLEARWSDGRVSIESCPLLIPPSHVPRVAYQPIRDGLMQAGPAEEEGSGAAGP